MTVKFLLPLVLVSALALTACGKNDAETTPAAAATPAPVTAPAATPAAVAPAETPAMAPATTAPTPEDAMKAIQAQAATMTDAQKQETIAAARKAAEDAGKAQGLTDEQVKQAADMAETATKQMLGVQ
ncbi:MAG: hypothetical protein JWP26_2401 [Devosia sp.]|uniref:hypothetical protein n=1 Tax=Devosia sp. TaxID=1871048 RepID=UPI00260D49F0|nr:hypothetical protein [Devosia sp.]MDB5587431.1 hypothetical protein [Devosia sp.]